MFEKGIDHWAQKELGLTRRKLELQNSLEAVEAEAGAALLDAEEADNGAGGSNYAGSLDRLNRARAEVHALAAAIAMCRVRRVGAIKAARAAEAVALRKEASDKSREMSSIEAKTSKLLEQVADLEGCEYRPAGAPRSSILRDEVARLQRAAQDIEQAGIPDTGVVDVGDVDGVPGGAEVALAVAMFPAVGPSVERVLDWFSGCEASAVATTHSGFGDLPRRVRIVWTAEEGIDVKQSYVFCAAKAAKRKGNFPDSDECLDVGSGRFRANAPTIATGGRNAQSPVEVASRGGWYRS